MGVDSTAVVASIRLITVCLLGDGTGARNRPDLGGAAAKAVNRRPKGTLHRRPKRTPSRGLLTE
jgi:hypothetical protein